MLEFKLLDADIELADVGRTKNTKRKTIFFTNIATKESCIAPTIYLEKS